jgi:hypothetical protein
VSQYLFKPSFYKTSIVSLILDVAQASVGAFGWRAGLLAAVSSERKWVGTLLNSVAALDVLGFWGAKPKIK